ncbi:MAG: deoxyhypusine synthase family protein [Blastocatellia bacterium]|nr:deoxyhypusine synthase family protein [Blastocatellia bacterium]
MMKKAKTSPYLKHPTQPIQIDRDRSVAGLLTKMETSSFQARNLAGAHNVWLNMLDDNTTIILGLSGALIPAGMRRIIAWLIRNRYVDVVVSTGANLFHDVHETLGRLHYLGSPTLDATELQTMSIGRMYDTLISEEEFKEADEWLCSFINTLESQRPYSSREFLHLLGHELSEIANEDGILTSAFKARVPVFCSGIVESMLARGIAASRIDRKSPFMFDVIQDVVEMAHILAGSVNTGVIYFGAGTPPNFVQQAHSTASVINSRMRTHKYSVQVFTESPHMSSAHLQQVDERDNWNKTPKDMRNVTVFCDPTIVMPILVTGLSQSATKQIKQRRKPTFTHGRDLVTHFA